jgi:hypothetical protein
VLPLDLNLLRFYNIIHVGRSVAGCRSLGKEKISLNFTAQMAKIWLRGPLFSVPAMRAILIWS